jgi:hypothetical protein
MGKADAAGRGLRSRSEARKSAGRAARGEHRTEQHRPCFYFTKNKAGGGTYGLGPFRAPDQQKAEIERKQVVITEEMLAAGLNGLSFLVLK